MEMEGAAARVFGEGHLCVVLGVTLLLSWSDQRERGRIHEFALVAYDIVEMCHVCQQEIPESPKKE